MAETRVSVGLGSTINTGDFESLRIDVRIDDDTRPGESVDDAFNRVYSKVEQRVQEKVESYRKELAGYSGN